MKDVSLSSISMITFGFFASHALSDASEPWQVGLQDPATPRMESMLFFHNYLTILLIAIGVFVSWMLGVVFLRFGSRVNLKTDKFSRLSSLETFWTMVPAAILLVISVPSFSLLYLFDELIAPVLYAEVALEVVTLWSWAFSKREVRIVVRIALYYKRALLWAAAAISDAVCSGSVSLAVFKLLRFLLGFLFGQARPGNRKTEEKPMDDEVVGNGATQSVVDWCRDLWKERDWKEVLARVSTVVKVFSVISLVGGAALSYNLSLAAVAILMTPSSELLLEGSEEIPQSFTEMLQKAEGEPAEQEIQPKPRLFRYEEGKFSVVGCILFFGVVLLFHLIRIKKAEDELFLEEVIEALNHMREIRRLRLLRLKEDLPDAGSQAEAGGQSGAGEAGGEGQGGVNEDLGD